MLIFIRRKHLPFWLDNEESLVFPTLKDRIKVDVAIVGGGIVGITTGLMLKKQGFKVAIIESKKIASDVTGSTTAKLTISSNLIYDKLLSNFGMDTALKFKDASIIAFNKISEIVKEYEIDCDYEKIPLYLYSTHIESFKDIEKEYKALKKLNIDADLTNNFQMPFNGESFEENIEKNNDTNEDISMNKGIRYNNQAVFNPKKYCDALVKLIPGNESYVFEKTKVTNVREGEINRVVTENGEIIADSIVIATNSPIYDPSSTLSYMSQIRSYMLGAYLNEQIPDAMFVDINPFHTSRKASSEKGDLLIIAGGHHFTGKGKDTSTYFKDLIEYTKEKFNVKSIEYYWSNEDNKTIDGLPIIGETSKKGIYVATGFGSWGLVKGTLAGMMLTDLISNKKKMIMLKFSLQKDLKTNLQ